MNEYRPPMHPANLPPSVAGKRISWYLYDGTINVSKEMFLLLSIHLVPAACMLLKLYDT